MATKQWRNVCCNPFNKLKHNVKDRSQLRTVTKRTCEEFPSILPGEKICRKKLSSVSVIPTAPEKVEFSNQPFSSSETDHSSESFTASSVKEFQASVAKESRERANEYFRAIGTTPITKRKLQSRKYQKKREN